MLSLLLATLTATTPYDCSKFEPFRPIDTLKADITVHRLPDDLICETTLNVELKDIRGREADWYWCDKSALSLVCQTDSKQKAVTLSIRPAMVIRGWAARDALDAHMHVFLVPENDESKLQDTFTQSLGFDLTQRELILNGASGGRGSASEEDSFYVRVHLHK